MFIRNDEDEFLLVTVKYLFAVEMSKYKHFSTYLISNV